MAVARAGAGAAAESSPGLGRTGRDPPWRWLESLFGAGPAVAALAAGSALGVARIVWLGCASLRLACLPQARRFRFLPGARRVRHSGIWVVCLRAFAMAAPLLTSLPESQGYVAAIG